MTQPFHRTEFELPACAHCGTHLKLRVKSEFYIAREYTCEACFKGQDDGPCFDHLPEA